MKCVSQKKCFDNKSLYNIANIKNISLIDQTKHAKIVEKDVEDETL